MWCAGACSRYWSMAMACSQTASYQAAWVTWLAQQRTQPTAAFRTMPFPQVRSDTAHALVMTVVKFEKRYIITFLSDKK